VFVRKKIAIIKGPNLLKRKGRGRKTLKGEGEKSSNYRRKNPVWEEGYLSFLKVGKD